MASRFRYLPLCVCLTALVEVSPAQTGDIHGQASAWGGGTPAHPSSAQFGLRYIPDLLVEEGLTEGLSANMELSVNAFATARYQEDQRASYDRNLRLYRAWVRVATERFEARIGLQKISFGSALLFRPLMWFDRIDPRDPLQLTDGVYGVLGRYTMQDNANFWLWGLYGNNATKGWEISPTRRNTVEYGGRAQSPLLGGELGLTYHHRRADLAAPAPAGGTVPEDRLGLDGKWDIGIGVWFEAALIREQTDIPGMKFQRQWTLGADYTFGVGSGLYAAAEYFRMDYPVDAFAPVGGRGFSGLSLSYPLGVLDQVSAMVYRDWTESAWYRIATLQRKYDDWSLYLLGFWNPSTIRLINGGGGTGAFAGTGLQIIVVFNH